MRVAIIGAGPAGLMAAEVLAEAGHEVSVYDQRRSPARKFVLAGRGGLNITHSEPLDAFLDRYGPEREHLEPAIRAFPPDALREWCALLGQPTFVGSSGRVFPEAFRAVPLLRSWMKRLGDLGVKLNLQHRWEGFTDERNTSFTDLPTGERIDVAVDHTLLALGGPTWPKVGGDGSWAAHLKAIGVDVAAFEPANCGVWIEWSDTMRDRFAGVPLKNVNVRSGDAERRGDVIVTTTGLEGGPIYGVSRAIRDRLAAPNAPATLDLWPDLTAEALGARLVERRRDKDSVSTWLRKAGFAPVAVSLIRDATDNAIPLEPGQLAALSQAVPLPVTSMASLDRAISAAGGVRWDDVDEELRLRAAPAISIVGEMLDWEAPTGGYLLQAVVSTARWGADALI